MTLKLIEWMLKHNIVLNINVMLCSNEKSINVYRMRDCSKCCMDKHRNYTIHLI
jgi:hypothetical protein